MAAACQKLFVDKKQFVHMYENLDYTSGFYILTNAHFDKALSFSSCRVSHKWSAENFYVDCWFKPIKSEGRNGSSEEKETDNQKIDIDIKSSEFQDLLANLNSCFEDDNLRVLDTKLIGNEKLTEKEELIVTGLGIHMIQKLVGKAQVCSSKCDKPCPCAAIEPQGECPERVPLSRGLMYIGSRQTWHGELDLCAVGVGLTAAIPDRSGDSDMIDDDGEDSQGKRTNLEFIMDWKAHSHAIAQAIVFGFTEFNRHRDLSSLIPTVLLNHECFLVLIYDPVTDSLMGPRNPVYYINKNITEETDPRRYLGIFFLWLVLNHRFFFAKKVRDVQIVTCKFRKKTEKEKKLREYEKLREFQPPFKVTDMHSRLENPANLVLTNKRKQRDWDSE